MKSPLHRLQKSANLLLAALFVVSISNAALSQPKKSQAQPTTTTQTKVKAWSIDQYSRVYGDVRALIAPGGFRMTYLKSGLNFLCLPPFTAMSIFNVKTGKYCIVKVASYRSLVRPMSLVSGISITDVPLIKKTTKTIEGVKTDWYESPESFRTQQLKVRAANECAGSAVSRMHFASTSSLSIPPAIFLPASKVVEVPLTKGIPIECTYFDMDDEEKHHLKTFKCKSVQVPLSEFSLPKGLKLVNQAEQVNVGEGDQDVLDLMLSGGRKRVEKQK